MIYISLQTRHPSYHSLNNKPNKLPSQKHLLVPRVITPYVSECLTRSPPLGVIWMLPFWWILLLLHYFAKFASPYKLYKQTPYKPSLLHFSLITTKYCIYLFSNLLFSTSTAVSLAFRIQWLFNTNFWIRKMDTWNSCRVDFFRSIWWNITK